MSVIGMGIHKKCVAVMLRQQLLILDERTYHHQIQEEATKQIPKGQNMED